MMRSNECHIKKVSGVVNIHLKRGSIMAMVGILRIKSSGDSLIAMASPSVRSLFTCLPNDLNYN